MNVRAASTPKPGLIDPAAIKARLGRRHRRELLFELATQRSQLRDAEATIAAQGEQIRQLEHRLRVAHDELALFKGTDATTRTALRVVRDLEGAPS